MDPVDETVIGILRQDRRFNEVVTVEDHDPPLGDIVHPVPCPADPLQTLCHGLGGVELHHEIDGTDVDPKLQRGGTDHHPQLPVLEALLHIEPCLS